MIVWLASYPRSGNTLLRILLHQTLGITSYAEHNQPIVENEMTGGFLVFQEDWETFYQKASDSTDAVFVKTHHPPKDDQPAIYVVRDGRKVYTSYAAFHQRFNGPRGPSLLELVLGLDYYGSWSDHFRAWAPAQRGNTLLLRYEDLVQPSASCLAQIAGFLGQGAPPKSWQNPFKRLQAMDAGFFRQGETRWRGDPAWSDPIDALFFQRNGTLMQELGYASQDEVSLAGSQLAPELSELGGIVQRLAATGKALEGACQKRLSLIESLSRTCDERLALIQELDRACRDRDRIIDSLSPERPARS